MRKKLVSLVPFLMGLLVLLSVSMSTSAAVLKFSVEPTIPENQVDKSKTYFDLKVSPGQEQTLSVHMRNDTDEDVIVTPTVNTAKTNLNGLVEYGASSAKNDKTLSHKMEDVLTLEKKEYTIPAKNSIDVKLKLKMPEKEFDGLMTGGITFQEKEEKESEKASKSKQGLAIENKYAFVVAVVLRETENLVPSDLKLGKVAPMQINARNAINADLHNPKAKFLNKVKIKAEVTKQGKDKVLYKSNNENMQIAPNSIFNYPILLEGQPLKAGKYTLHMTVNSKDDKWTFNRDFEINKEEADKFNEKDVSIKKDYTWLYITIGVVLVLLAFLIIFLIARRQVKKKEKELEALKREMKK